MAQPDFTFQNTAGSVREIVFPVAVAPGAGGRTRFMTDKQIVDSGHSATGGRWEQPLVRVDGALGVNDLAKLAQLEAFFRVVYGDRDAFLLEDPRDHQSSDPVDEWSQALPPITKDDQWLGDGDGAKTVFQLRKAYTVLDIDGAAQTVYRPIYRPQPATLLVALNGVLQTLTTHYTLDRTAGQITFVTPPGGGVTVTAGFKFWIPARFEESEISTDFEAYGAGEVSVPITEVRILGDA